MWVEAEMDSSTVVVCSVTQPCTCLCRRLVVRYRCASCEARPREISCARGRRCLGTSGRLSGGWGWLLPAGCRRWGAVGFG